MNLTQMDPVRFAHAAKQACVLAVELAEAAGNEVPDDIRWIAEASEEEIAARRHAVL